MVNNSNKKSPEEIKKEMDAAAEIARKDLEKIPTEKIKIVAEWIKSYYLKTGYKRLCRMLLEEIR